ncbi:NAD(P)H-dependent glycerol-3-phosphate dehydrogenase [Desulfohalobium retbaense]|uniref:Glycerol-3-phosphate dehydrogenase [NAD(P)+] n=1 Tax=Desulfohalobium retbaense (strain ATCC 49708 / DSM 5692 / JCM 16813 / HR100) TaxID=485915 RepID=C8X5K8_DESRD|nr:NAD(P)H-dependent glycerol-3-phosphate dehydrogenase [Desulfohalobium retbaense]ACV69705.1 Glycerol-3-phosphate dehydrogenase (NAD(P)(+)) [Desulfohalobium retbaense DSM 5692]
MHIAVLGAGSWGTTLANVFARKGESTSLWVREPKLAATIRTQHQNPVYLPDIALSPEIQAHPDLETVLKSAELIVVAVPCQFLRGVLNEARPLLPKKPFVICASKGIELETLKPMSEVVAEALHELHPTYAMLSGPSFAREVARELPTAVSLGCADTKRGKMAQAALSTEAFRVYTNSDVRGVELGGAIKNIIAIAAGISDGLGFGSDARAALITRGLAEMSRLGQAMGGRAQTFMGLSGMGDLVLTCTGDLSRNRQVGLKLAHGLSLMDILSDMRMVAEGVKTTEAVFRLGQRLNVELPITEQVYRILYEEKNPSEGVSELMGRELKDE